MYELINGNFLEVKEYREQRVVTFKDIDTMHQRADGTAGRNFRANRKHFIENVDFFRISPDEFRRTLFCEMDLRQQNDVILVTETGYLMLVKSFTDDLAWIIQRELVSNYFRKSAEIHLQSPYFELIEKQKKLEKRIANLEETLESIETQAKTGKFLDNRKIVFKFIDECCQPIRHDFVRAGTTTRQFHEAFYTWCDINHIERILLKDVVSGICAYFGKSYEQRTKVRHGVRGTKYYIITLKPEFTALICNK